MIIIITTNNYHTIFQINISIYNINIIKPHYSRKSIPSIKRRVISNSIKLYINTSFVNYLIALNL